MDKLPPQNIAAEKSLLGCLMIDQDAIYKVADFLQIKDFYKPVHQMIFESIVELFVKREPVDLLSVSSKLGEISKIEEIGGASYLTDLINSVPTASNILHYAKIVQDKRVLRDLISAGYDISNLALQEAESIDVLLDRAEKRIFSIAQKTLSQSFVHVKDTLEETWKRIEELSKQKGGLRGIPTGFRDLDNMLAGLQRSDLVILAARPSLGKSALAVDIAKNVACKYKMPVGLFSLEMSKDQIVDRLISAQADVDLWKIRTGKLSDQGPNNDFERIQKAMAELAEAPIYIDDVSSSNVIQMRAMARRLAMDKGLGLLIIDYLQLMEGRGNIDNIVQQVSENSRALKSIAKELNIPVLVLSQLSRAVEHRMPPVPRLSDLRESGCLTGDTLITRADTGERIPIKDLVGQTNIPVYSLDENWQIKESKISTVFSSGKKMIYELTTRSGFKIKASANHPFLKINGWTRLDQLNPKDKIAIPRMLPEIGTPIEIQDEKIILLAHLIGDGSYLLHNSPSYTSPSERNIDIVRQCAKKAFNVEGKLYEHCPHPNQSRLILSGKNKKAKNEINAINQWLREIDIFGQKCSRKEIPKIIFKLPSQQISLFVKHLWATDGSIYFAKKGKNYILCYSSTSQKIIQQLQHLLLRVGIISNQTAPRIHKEKTWKNEYQLLISDKEHQLEFLNKVGIFGREQEIAKAIEHINKVPPKPKIDVIPKEAWQTIAQIREIYNIPWREFAEEMNTTVGGLSAFNKTQTCIGRQKMLNISAVLPDPRIEKMAKSSIFWDNIISIKPLFTTEVFDATVPDNHNFLADDIIVHNSIEQDADVVLFIYREDKYKPNSERKNVAEIIIAKHRNGPVGKIELYFDETRVTFRDMEKGAYQGADTEEEEESII